MEIVFKEDNILDFISEDEVERINKKDNEDTERKTLNTEETKNSSMVDCEEVILYEWDLDVLDKIFSEKEEGKNIMHGLHSMWLVYFSKLIAKSDKEIKKIGNNIGRQASMILNGIIKL